MMFTIFLKCFSKRTIGSDYASKLFHTLMYAIYIGEKIKLGQVLRTQFIQSPTSTTKDSEISCTIFSSILVKNARDHYRFPHAMDVCMDVNPKMNVGTFLTTDDTNFSHIGSVMEVILAKVPSNNEIIKLYKFIPKFDERGIPTSLQTILDVGVVLRRVRGKRKMKVVEEVFTTKSKP
ncbi:unnamed protein product [Lactuca virosa]|uniref:Uncharacterized protein n=1 Tax=Lactuca virosa TaxID=75947 RepID=A0AAU9M3S7_9ASTR|nr:unnamed protein product [Lactuca virosa]